MTKRENLLLIALPILALLVSARLDRSVAGTIPQIPSLVSSSRFLSLLGNGLFLIPVSLALYVWGRAAGKGGLREAGRAGLISVLSAGIAVNMLKAAFERPRIPHAGDFVTRLLNDPSFFDFTGRFNSFPSGHTAASFAFAYALGARYPRLKAPLYAVASLIALSRVYLGSHYPTDVVAGAILGVSAGYVFAKGAGGAGDWDKKLKFLLITLTLFISFFKSGSFLLFDVDEAVFSEASREMVETGDFLTPSYNYEPRFDKPILFYWFTSLSFFLFGTTEFAARFTSGVFGSLLVLITYFFVKRQGGYIAAVFSALILLLNIAYFVYSHAAITDMTLAFFVAGSVYSFHLGATTDDKRWYWAFWASMALAALTKGAVGVLFPLAVALLHLLLSGGLKEFKAVFRPAHLALFIAVAAPWFAAEAYVNGWDFINAFIVKHHIKRYTGVISSHGGPPYYYIGVLLIGFFPWAALLPQALWKGYREWREKTPGLYLLSSVWFLFIFVFFSVASTKLPNYIFPLIPAASIMAGLSVSRSIEGGDGGIRYSIYFMMVMSVAASAALFAVPFMGMEAELPFPDGFFFALSSIFLMTALFAGTTLIKPLPSFSLLSSVAVFLLVFLRLHAVPPANLRLQGELYDYSRYARTLGKGFVFAEYEINKPSLRFYYGGKVLRLEKTDSCSIREHSKRSKLLIVTDKERLGELKDSRLRVINEGRDYVLLTNAADAPGFKTAER